MLQFTNVTMQFSPKNHRLIFYIALDLNIFYEKYGTQFLAFVSNCFVWPCKNVVDEAILKIIGLVDKYSF